MSGGKIKAIFLSVFILVLSINSIANASEKVSVAVIEHKPAALKGVSWEVILPISNVVLRVESKIDTATGKMNLLKLNSELGEVSISNSVLEKFDNPQLESIRVECAALVLSDIDWGMEVNFNFGKLKKVKGSLHKMEYSKVIFYVGKNGVQSVEIKNPGDFGKMYTAKEISNLNFY